MQGIVYSLQDKKKEAEKHFENYQSFVREEFPKRGFLDDACALPVLNLDKRGGWHQNGRPVIKIFPYPQYNSNQVEEIQVWIPAYRLVYYSMGIHIIIIRIPTKM